MKKCSHRWHFAKSSNIYSDKYYDPVHPSITVGPTYHIFICDKCGERKDVKSRQ